MQAALRAEDAPGALGTALAGLDAHQLAAVIAEETATTVRAPVGSGKTLVLTLRVLYLRLVRGVPLDDMAVLTFTHRAASEIRERLVALAGPALAREVHAARWLGTFHGVALSLLARALPVETLGYRRDFTVIDEAERDKLIGRVIRAHGKGLGPPRRLRQRLQAHDQELNDLAARVAEEKRARNVMDFDDLLANATCLLSDAQVRPRWVIVDELQDCEPRDLAFVEALRGPGAGFFAVGDPHQAIYGWRGGSVDVFDQVEARFGCTRRTLPMSYRSTRRILEGAKAVLGLQPVAGGALLPVRDAGSAIAIRRHHDPLSEAIYLAERIAALCAQGVDPRHIAVLCRLHAQVPPLRDALTARGLVCVEEHGDEPGVRLLTLHAAKGLEFHHVFICGLNDGVLPLHYRSDQAEERRLLFVGLTRAREAVELSYVTVPHLHAATRHASPLLAELPAETVEWAERAPAAPLAAPGWQAGQAVRHPRYGEGVVVSRSDDAVECEFGKLGRRAFPLALCPLVRV